MFIQIGKRKDEIRKALVSLGIAFEDYFSFDKKSSPSFNEADLVIADVCDRGNRKYVEAAKEAGKDVITCGCSGCKEVDFKDGEEMFLLVEIIKKLKERSS